MAEHDTPAQDPERFTHLPGPLDPRDLLTSQETGPPPDPDDGRAPTPCSDTALEASDPRP